MNRLAIHFRAHRNLLMLASALFIVGAAGTVAAAEAVPGPPNTTKGAMQELFAQLQILLPAAASGELGNPERASEIKAAFDRMQTRINALPKHGDGLDPGARLFGRALARDIRRASVFYREGQYDNAAFFVEALVDDCIACHARRKADDSLVTQGFVDQSALADLDPLQLAAIATATRRFDDAMDRYERAFREEGAESTALLGPMTRYLTVTLRVARDPERAQKTLRHFASRPGTAKTVRSDLEHWIKTLDGLSAKDFKGTSIERARRAIDRAERVATYPADPKALIEYLAASAQFHDLVFTPQDSPDAAAEIYERLGQAELGVAQHIWLSRADLYWETAIRLAPNSPAAQRAFKRLEEETRAGYTGSGGTRIPADEMTRLAELSSLLSGSPTAEAKGAELFSDHCAACHGSNAQGRGAFSDQLMWSPADLTRIATRRGGEFPEQDVFELIARRDPLGRHQSPEMPQWGKYWKNDEKIDALVAYLRSIQRP